MAARVAVPAETRAGETRVALTPDAVKRLVADGFEVVVEQGAGEAATFTDAQYRDAGGSIAASAAEACGGAAAVVRVNAPSPTEAALLEASAVHLSFLQPASSEDALRTMIERRATAVSFDLVPRISRAQSMDALSSQATVSGYRASLAGAQRLAKFFPMFMTAAGTVPPAKVLVMGVGVAGLQAIATARRLGAAVRAYDVRAAAKEEAESLGATFVDLGVSAEGAGGYARELTAEELDAQRQALAAEVAASDVVITTAAVPGRRAPVLVTRPDGGGDGPRSDRGRHGRRQRRQLRGHGPRRGGPLQPRGRRRARQPAGEHAHPRELPVRAQRAEPPRPVRREGRDRARLGRRDRRRRHGAARRGGTNESAATLLGVPYAPIVAPTKEAAPT